MGNPCAVKVGYPSQSSGLEKGFKMLETVVLQGVSYFENLGTTINKKFVMNTFGNPKVLNQFGSIG